VKLYFALNFVFDKFPKRQPMMLMAHGHHSYFNVSIMIPFTISNIFYTNII
jgi:hypothetical protein